MRMFALVVLVLGVVLSGGCSRQETTSRQPSASTPARSKARSAALTRSISIPVRVVADPATPPADPAMLTITEGGDDEPPEGPATFDVWPDGGLVIADPTRQRLVFYDSGGKYRTELTISFAAERVRVLPHNALSVVRAQTGDRYIFEADNSGTYQTPRFAAERDPDPDADDAGVAKLVSGSQATVSPRPSPTTESAPTDVRFNAVGEGMVSVRRIGSDARQRTYVAIEAAFPGQRVDVRKIVRQYSPGGEFVEMTDIPIDYLVHPVDEFRVRDGVLYQLMPKASEVRINIWEATRP